MKRCPRCNTSMIIGQHTNDAAPITEYPPVWKCLGCGREFPITTEQQDKEQRWPRSL